MNCNLYFSDSQYAALVKAASLAGLPINVFVVSAIRAWAARYGVDVPTSKPNQIKAYTDASEKVGGRPRKAVDHAMEYHVPAGERALVCPWCQRDFRSDDWRAVYCSPICKRRTENLRNYQKRRNAK